MSKQNGCLPLCYSLDTFHLTKAFTEAHGHTQTFSHNSCASTALWLPITDLGSTIALHKPCALRLTITFPLAATDGPHMHNMETAGKVRMQCGKFMKISSQWLELRDGTTLWWLYHHDEHILRRCTMPCGVQNEDITHILTQVFHIMFT